MATPECKYHLPGLEPEKLPSPKIVVTWRVGDEKPWHRASLKHNDAACDPTSSCDSLTFVNFREDSRQPQATRCGGCDNPVVVNILDLKIELQRTRQLPFPSSL